jgi:hypothetical protein
LEFRRDFVTPHEAESGQCAGVARATAAALRGIQYLIPEATPPDSGRAVCVIDRVDPPDPDAHATLEYSESLKDAVERRSQGVRGTVRMRVHATIADAFGPIVPIAEAFSSYP